MSRVPLKNLAYLAKQPLCPQKTGLALGISLFVSVLFLVFLLPNLATLLKMEPVLQLKFTLEFAFVLACLTALWKHALKN